MGEPYFIPDGEMLSTCCGALSSTEIFDSIAICSDCKEWAEFSSEDEDEDEK